MRISIRPGDPGFTNWRPDLAGLVAVHVDGKLVKKVHTADEELGKAWGHALDEHGNAYLDPDNPLQVMPIEYTGRVEIKVDA